MVSAIRPFSMKCFFILLAWSIFLCSHAQKDKLLKLQVNTYDTARTAVFYDLQFLTDSTKRQSYKRGKTILRISEKYLSFTDYYMLLRDSLNDYGAISEKRLFCSP